MKVGDVVAELASLGKRAVVDMHRGVTQHTNGFYNVLGWNTVNALLGNYDWQGGMSAAKTYGYDGAKGGPFNVASTPGAIPAFGISLNYFGHHQQPPGQHPILDCDDAGPPGM